jgi:hypothetical protein
MLRRFHLALLAAATLLAPLPAGAAIAAERALEARDDVNITRDTEFDREHGVRSGSGTARDPYVISGWSLSNLRINDTRSHFVIRDNEILGQMVLDWNGPGQVVVRNRVGDLRVNQNVPRSGQATSGLIAHNTFGLVGQLRHWDGVFEHNVVGAPVTDMAQAPTGQAVNFDGFNGARFRHNTIYGYMDSTLHGHHHGSGFGRPSHDHAGEAMAEGEHAGHGGTSYAAVDHSRRYHEVFITNNTIWANASYALGYNDIAHSVNDRTNASETDPALEAPHVHYTRVHLVGNRLLGAGLAVDVFNAADDLHEGTRRGLVEIRANRITLQRAGWNGLWGGPDGIRIQQVRNGEVRVIDNSVGFVASEGLHATFPFRDWDQGAGIRVYTLEKADLYLWGNSVVRRPFGIVASQFTKSTHWSIKDFRTTEVGQRVVYDESVANPPKRS